MQTFLSRRVNSPTKQIGTPPDGPAGSDRVDPIAPSWEPLRRVAGAVVSQASLDERGQPQVTGSFGNQNETPDTANVEGSEERVDCANFNALDHTQIPAKLKEKAGTDQPALPNRRNPVGIRVKALMIKLASDNRREVVDAARALCDMLAEHGLTMSDLAECAKVGAQLLAHEGEALLDDPWGEFFARVRFCAQRPHHLASNEERFLASMLLYDESTRQPTPKQVSWANDIYERIVGGSNE